MRSSTLSILLSLVSLSQLSCTFAQPVLACQHCIDTHGNYTSTSAYSRNLKTLLNTITSNTQINNGFYNFSAGQDSDKVYGIAVCRADISIADCHSCLDDITKMLPEVCPTQKEAIAYYFSRCMLRYSDRSLSDTRDNSPNCTVQNPQQIPDPDVDKFKQTLVELFDGLKQNASAGGSRYKFATGVAKVTTSLTAYALTQCNPDLSSSDCSNCLQNSISQLQKYSSVLSGAGIYGPICSVEFENYPFASSILPLIPSSMVNTSSKGRKSTHKSWMIVVVLIVMFVVLATFVYFLSRRRMRRIRKERNGQIKYADTIQFDFSTMLAATDHFSDARRLGKCNAASPATIYKGMLPGGQEVAVKRFSKTGRDGELEFNNELLLSANHQHRNLVKLLGFCIEKDIRFLIYEFVPNGSLDWFLSDPVKRASLEWEARHFIILGIARGLLYLHEDSQLRLIHRDLKANNIHLGPQMNAKISNFSKGSLVNADQHRGETSTIVGTYGYMPPEYAQRGHFSVKSDVFSFGVVLMEIISGQMIRSFTNEEKEESLLSYVWRKWSENTALDVVDQALPIIAKHTTQILRCIKIGLLCVQEDPACRPTMSTVVFMLNSNVVDIAEPLAPAPVILSDMDLPSSCYNSKTDKSYSQGSVNEISISYLDPR